MNNYLKLNRIHVRSLLHRPLALALYAKVSIDREGYEDSFTIIADHYANILDCKSGEISSQIHYLVDLNIIEMTQEGGRETKRPHLFKWPTGAGGQDE